ncbi:glutamine amidotransferase [Verrucomicrobium sp. GAS474]|uniref:imidazole glycerol phosphate synthase subunit HisH n=1 Tax=Verrucomicrobium sp. GAS474 TaxID=1882831 RepID=UPI00087D89F4|nr:imidazole glycerol phosphate synthase subunit HisH [Verrucomicrobium sp. GAS474]SDU29658.1 glutamine amidotransferase [Verrucomicrobium sp. GAS474]
MIGIIDYGMGNLRSVEKALESVGAKTRFITGTSGLDGLTGLVLPGVGAFTDCVGNLRATGLWEPIKEWIAADKPFFGICLGYQMLFEGSEEGPDIEGLGVFKGKVVRFPKTDLKVPQMGWNEVTIVRPSLFTEGVVTGDHVYFVHSFYPAPEDPGIVAMTTEYGLSFASAVGKGNLFATQFHPEKSQRVGLKLLSNFAKLAS